MGNHDKAIPLSSFQHKNYDLPHHGALSWREIGNYWITLRWMLSQQTGWILWPKCKYKHLIPANMTSAECKDRCLKARLRLVWFSGFHQGAFHNVSVV